MRVCNVPGCGSLTNSRRCPTHARQARRQRNQNGNAAYATRGHRDFRTAVLHRDPTCVIPGCKKPSTVADHHPRTRRELVALNLNPNDPQYGRGLCTHHHNTHTAHTTPGGWHAQR